MKRLDCYHDRHGAVLLLNYLEGPWWHGMTDGYCWNTIVSGDDLIEKYKFNHSLTEEQLKDSYSHVKIWTRHEAFKELDKHLNYLKKRAKRNHW